MEKETNFVEDIFGKVKGTIAKVLREIAADIEEGIDMKWVIIGLAILFFWKKKK